MDLMIFGGDLRQIAASRFLRQKGYKVKIRGIDRGILEKYGEINLYAEEYEHADAVILPLPLSCDGININTPFSKQSYPVKEVFSEIKKKTPVLAGMVSAFHRKCAEEVKIRLYDYYESSEFQIKNAIPTAEGAILTFMKCKDITVFGSRCTVVGYGKTGKALSERLAALGAHVTVAARSKNDRASAFCRGMSEVSTDEEAVAAVPADCIFNTVPANIFDEDFSRSLSEDTVYIELASKPYGMSEKARDILGDRYISAPSLPGRISPVTAGKIIADTICNFFEKEVRS